MLVEDWFYASTGNVVSESFTSYGDPKYIADL